MPQSTPPPANPAPATGAPRSARDTLRRWAAHLRDRPLIPLMMAGAAVIAIVVGLLFWASGPSYSVLFSNLGYRDGGKITSILKQEHVPYKFAQNGHALLVPDDDVYNLRLSLAAKGLPTSGGVGLSIMDHQPFGVSEFAEKVNYERGLQGELDRSIEVLNPVRKARVSLALPDHSPFVEDNKPAKATVVLTLRSGRTLDRRQVRAIVHLVSSAVRDLSPADVTVVDQRGTLLTAHRAAGDPDRARLAYTQEVESAYRQRIEAAIAPIVGAQNVHAEVTADISFDHHEQTAEQYGPNQGTNPAAVLSKQTSEEYQTRKPPKGGIPGALSNTPPGVAPSPINARRNTKETRNGGKKTSAGKTRAGTFKRSGTTNYDVDKTITHTKTATGALQRLSVAVVVNSRSVGSHPPRTSGAKSKKAAAPIGSTEMQQIKSLAQAAMGYTQARGDTLSVIDVAFAPPPRAKPESLAHRLDLAMWLPQAIRYLAILLVAYMLYRLIVRPLIKHYLESLRPAPVTPAPRADDDESGSEPEPRRRRGHRGYESALNGMQDMARKDPAMLATIFHSWLHRNA